jgi:heme A synthase
MRQTVSKTHTLAAIILATLLLIYISMFILYHMSTDLIFIDIYKPIPLFSEFKFVIPLFVLAISNTLYLGKCTAKDDLEMLNYNYIKTIEIKKNELVNYITLSKILSKKNTKELIEDFINKLNSDH